MALESTAPHTTESVANSLTELLEHEARQLYHLVTQLEDVVGTTDADNVVDTGLANLARWQAERLSVRQTGGPDLPGTLTLWTSGERYGLTKLGWGALRIAGHTLTIHVDHAPDLELLASRGREDLYLRMWRHRVREAFTRADTDATVAAVWDPDRHAAVIDVTAHSIRDFAGFDSGGVEFDAETGLEETVKTRAAQFHFIANAAIDAFDATGEHAVRRGVQEFARERGGALRRRHEAQGRSLDLQSMMSDFDYGGEGVWRFAPGTLTPSSWSQDCTHCPFAQVWRELDGLDTGYIYDMEFHVAEFMEYNPRIRVQWDQLQTRGDPICAFRFTMPADDAEPGLTARPQESGQAVASVRKVRR